MPSADCSFVTPGSGTLTDPNGRTWAVSSGGQVVINGVVDSTTSNVVILYYYQNALYQENTSDNWYSMSDTAPAGSWGGSAAPPCPPPSPPPPSNPPTSPPGSGMSQLGQRGSRSYFTLADITSADWELMLDFSSPTGAPGSGIGQVVQGVADINQCIGTILSTPKGSDPFRPDFACDLWHWLDMPINVARAHLVTEIVEAITKYEPRVRILSVVVNLISGTLSQLSIIITWQLKIDIAGVGSQQLTITVPRNLV